MSHSNPVEAILSKVKQTLKQYQMLTDEKRIVVGFSGGADSMMLLHFLHQMQLPVLAAHVHHGLRGEEADRDEKAAELFCEKFKIPLEILHTDVQKRANQLGIGVEECGREVRYSFFQELAGTKGGKIATAHTLSDVCETVLLHMTRGTGLKGLCGIPPIRNNIIRPLIGITRDEVEQYCEYYQLPFVTDSTNFEKHYTRNRLRLDVIPTLKQINPLFEEAILHLTRQCKDDMDYLEQQAASALSKAEVKDGYCTDAFLQMPKAIRSRAIFQALKQVKNITPSYVQMEQIHKAIEMRNGSVTVTGMVQFCVEGNFTFLRVGKIDKSEWGFLANSTKITLKDGRKIHLNHQIVNNYKNDINFKKMLFHNSVDYGTISDNATFRNRREGDSFRPAGRGVTKSLKKLFNEAKIPPSKRDDIVILADGDHILWIEGFGPSEFGCVKPNTKELISIDIEGAKIESSN